MQRVSFGIYTERILTIGYLPLTSNYRLLTTNY